jgi:hypothetical protein
MVESTLELISSHVASRARPMARQKQIIAELKSKTTLANIIRDAKAPPPSLARVLLVEGFGLGEVR